MNVPLADLFIIFCAAAVIAIAVRWVPRQIIPEGVALIAFGAAVGPYALNWVEPGQTITIMGNIGMGLMFLLAGYEIEPRSHFTRDGRRAALLWLGCLGVAFLTGWLLRAAGWQNAVAANAIAIVATALGTVTPVLKARGVGPGTRLGDAVLRHGTAGQMGAPIALAIILGGEGTWVSAGLLLVFLTVVAVLFAVPDLIRRRMGWLADAVRAGSKTTSQIDVRIVMVVLLGMLLLTSVLGVDAVMAAFLAGVVIREAFPDPHSDLTVELEAVAFGVFIPVFLVLAGLNIDLSELVRRPWIPLLFLVANLALRVAPVALYSRFVDGFSVSGAAQIGLYTGIGLSLVAAVTQAAVRAGTMTGPTRSALIVAACLAVMLYSAAAGALGRREASARVASDG